MATFLRSFFAQFMTYFCVRAKEDHSPFIGALHVFFFADFRRYPVQHRST